MISLSERRDEGEIVSKQLKFLQFYCETGGGVGIGREGGGEGKRHKSVKGTHHAKL